MAETEALSSWMVELKDIWSGTELGGSDARQWKALCHSKVLVRCNFEGTGRAPNLKSCGARVRVTVGPTSEP